MKANNRGQLTVEAVLILTIFVSLMYAASNVMQSQRLLAKVVESPWTYLAGMIENGVWAPPAQGEANHPNHLHRHGTPIGDTP